jgi:predicted phage tail protein
MSDLVDIKFHGELKKVLKKDYRLAVKSVKEAFRAVNVMSGKKLSKYFIKPENINKEYRVLVNGKDIVGTSKKLDTPEKVNESEIVLERSTIKTIDVVPAVQGSGDVLDILLVVVAVILIVAGIFIAMTPGGQGLGYAMIVSGLGMLAAGISNLLAQPPEFEEFKDNSKTGRRSYIFSGPANVGGEGRGVPFGYGRLKIGSQVTDATFEITYADADISPLTT